MRRIVQALSVLGAARGSLPHSDDRKEVQKIAVTSKQNGETMIGDLDSSEDIKLEFDQNPYAIYDSAVFTEEDVHARIDQLKRIIEIFDDKPMERSKAAYLLGETYAVESHDTEEALKYFSMVEDLADNHEFFIKAQNYIKNYALISQITEEQRQTYLGEVYSDLTEGSVNYRNVIEVRFAGNNGHLVEKVFNNEGIEGALKYVEELIKENTGADVYNRHILMAKMGRYQEALDDLDSIPGVNNNWERSVIHLSMGNYPEALRYMNLVMSHELDWRKDQKDTSYLLGIIHAKMGNFEEVKQAFSKELERFPGDERTLQWRGVVNKALGKDEEAEADFAPLKAKEVAKVKTIKEEPNSIEQEIPDSSWSAYSIAGCVTVIAVIAASCCCCEIRIIIPPNEVRPVDAESQFRSNAKQEIEGFASTVLKFMLNPERPSDAERKAMLMVDYKGFSELFRELIPLDAAGRQDLVQEKLSQVLNIDEKSLTDDELYGIKGVLFTALDQVTSLQKNYVGNHIIKRAMPREDAPNVALDDELFKKILKIFNDRSEKFLYDFGKSIHDDEAVMRVAISDLFEQTIKEIMEEIAVEAVASSRPRSPSASGLLTRENSTEIAS